MMITVCTFLLRIYAGSRLIVHPVPAGETKTENVLFAYLLYCLAEKLRGSDKLDRHDREFLNVMLTNKLYRPALKRNGEKLKLFLKNFRD